MTETPSVEGDRLEEIARLVDPVAFALGKSFIDYFTGDRRLEPWNRFSLFLHTQEAERIWVAFERARQIAALPCKVGEAEAYRRVVPLETMVETAEALMANIEAVPNWIDSTELVTARAHAYVLVHDLPLTATPTTEADTGRGLREAATNLLKPFLHPADQLVDPNAGPALTVDGTALTVEVVVAAERLRRALAFPLSQGREDKGGFPGLASNAVAARSQGEMLVIGQEGQS